MSRVEQPAATLKVEIWRGGPDGGFRTYRVPRRDSQTVLDVVTHVQREIDPSLFYRFACRVGMCGSCATTVDGKPAWTCRTLVSRVEKDNAIRIAPLANLPIIRDLACDMTGFSISAARIRPLHADRPERTGFRENFARKSCPAGSRCGH